MFHKYNFLQYAADSAKVFLFETMLFETKIFYFSTDQDKRHKASECNDLRVPEVFHGGK